MSTGRGASFESDRDLGPEGFARAFVDAIAWGEHRRVWDLLGQDGRRTVLRVAVARGMDEALSARLRDGTATPSETERFLADLLNGLRADLAGSDLDTLEYRQDEVTAEGGPTWVVLTSPLPAELGGEVPVGTMELVQEGNAWRVARLSPRSRP
jgi:hypothetical protein